MGDDVDLYNDLLDEAPLEAQRLTAMASEPSFGPNQVGLHGPSGTDAAEAADGEGGTAQGREEYDESRKQLESEAQEAWREHGGAGTDGDDSKGAESGANGSRVGGMGAGGYAGGQHAAAPASSGATSAPVAADAAWAAVQATPGPEEAVEDVPLDKEMAAKLEAEDEEGLGDVDAPVEFTMGPPGSREVVASECAPVAGLVGAASAVLPPAASRRAFLVKPESHEAVARSLHTGKHAVTHRAREVLNQAYHGTEQVVLVFSVPRSSRFQGYALMRGPIPLGGNPMNPAVTPEFDVAWYVRTDLPFHETMHLRNSLNEGKPVKVGRDGQEIEPEATAKLLAVLDASARSGVGEVFPSGKKPAPPGTPLPGAGARTWRAPDAAGGAAEGGSNPNGAARGQGQVYGAAPPMPFVPGMPMPAMGMWPPMMPWMAASGQQFPQFPPQQGQQQGQFSYPGAPAMPWWPGAPGAPAYSGSHTAASAGNGNSNGDGGGDRRRRRSRSRSRSRSRRRSRERSGSRRNSSSRHSRPRERGDREHSSRSRSRRSGDDRRRSPRGGGRERDRRRR